MYLERQARQFMSRFLGSTYGVDDLVQDCRLAALQGRPYTRHVMCDALRMWHGGGKYCKRFADVVFLEDVSQILAVPAQAYMELLDKERMEYVKEALEGLPPKEQLVAYLIFYEGKTQRSIAYIMGVTQPRVAHLYKRFCSRMRRRLRKLEG